VNEGDEERVGFGRRGHCRALAASAFCANRGRTRLFVSGLLSQTGGCAQSRLNGRTVEWS
jgi:hypothetical protein